MTYTSKQACKIKGTVVQSIPNNSTTQIEFDTTDIDTGNMADLANDRIVIKKDGIYNIRSYWALDPVLDEGEYVGSQFNINGSIAKFQGVMSSGANNALSIGASDIFELSSGDLITMSVYHNEGSATNTRITDNGNPTLSVSQIK